MEINEIARVCHEVNRAYCASQGDHTQPTWEHAPDWQQRSAIMGVVFTIDHPDAGPDQSHKAWLEEKAREGWKWGPIKDPAAKEHPCFVPYEELPRSQKAKDYIFQAIVRALSGGQNVG